GKRQIFADAMNREPRPESSHRTNWPDERRRRGLPAGSAQPRPGIPFSAKEETVPIRYKPDRPTRKSAINRGPSFHLRSQKNRCRQRNDADKRTEGGRRAYSLGPHSIV